MNQITLFQLVCLAPLAFGLLVVRYRTGLLGLSLLNAALVGSASFSAFFFGTAAGLNIGWFTASHAEVLKYSVAGCVALAAGVYLSWHPLARLRAEALREKRPFPPFPNWMNPAFGWTCVGIGTAATFSLYFLGRVPTLSTALAGLQNLSRFGILVLLVVALRTGRWGHLLAAVGLSLPVLLAGALRSGHTPLSVDLLLPAALIVALHRRVTPGSFVVVVATSAVYMVLMGSWMSTRGMIRSGELSEYSLWQQAQNYVPAFAEEIGLERLNPNVIQSLLLDRIDMSDILAQQRAHQPDYEEYAHGGTFVDGFTALVPRVFWAEKPVIAGGSEFVKRFTGMTRAEDDETSIGVPYQFEFYANGGPWFVVIGLFVVGFLSGWTELALFRDYASLGKLLALAVVTLLVCNGGQRSDVTIPSIIAGGLSAWAAGWMFELTFPDQARHILGIQQKQVVREGHANGGGRRGRTQKQKAKSRNVKSEIVAVETVSKS